MQTTAHFLVERDGKEIELTVEGTYSPGSPGKIWGPPENCYPPEPAEAEIERVLKDGKTWEGQLSDEEEKQALAALYAAGPDSGPDVDPDDYDPQED